MSKARCHRWLMAVTGVLAFVPASKAAVSVAIVGDVATANISVQDALGDTYLATLVLRFQQPLNLTEACLGIDAVAVDAAGIAALDARLPDPAGLEIDADFPVLVSVSPPPGCGLEFVNDVEIELTTPELDYAAFSPYRLFKAPAGGAFADITEAIESGSVRARGRGGSFSEFVIAQDLSQDYAPDADTLFDLLEDEIDDPDIALSARTTLQTDLAMARAAHQGADPAAALAALDTFDVDLRGFAGTGIPNRWRSANDLVDEFGELAALAASLRFQLARLGGAP